MNISRGREIASFFALASFVVIVLFFNLTRGFFKEVFRRCSEMETTKKVGYREESTTRWFNMADNRLHPLPTSNLKRTSRTGWDHSANRRAHCQFSLNYSATFQAISNIVLFLVTLNNFLGIIFLRPSESRDISCLSSPFEMA